MLRGHILTSTAFPESKQRVALLAAGVPEGAIYVDDLPSAIRSTRTGNKLVVAGLRGLGRTDKEITQAVKAVHKKGALVMDAESKRTTKSEKTLKALIAEALVALANERRGPRKRRLKRDRRMPWDQVRQIYFNPLLSNEQVEELVAKGFAPMSYATMRRYFGKPRGAQVGRPSAKRLAQMKQKS